MMPLHCSPRVASFALVCLIEAAGFAGGCRCGSDASGRRDALANRQPVSIPRSVTIAEMDALVGREITFSGKAEYFSQLVLGFVRFGTRFEIYLSGMEGWPPGVEGRQVQATGLLSRRKIFRDPTVDEWGQKNGGGYWGEQYVVDHVRWQVLGDPADVRPRTFTIEQPPTLYQLEPLVGHTVSVEGHPSIEETGHGQAIGMRFERYLLCVEGPAQWLESETVVVRVTGTLDCRYDEPQPGLDSAGGVLVAARYRPRYILNNARWVLMPEKSEPAVEPEGK
jgi:hypothetical protein